MSPDNAAPPAPSVSPGLRGLHPAYFALVMATGIVSIGSYLLDMIALAKGLFAFNLAAYAAIWGLTIARFGLHRDALLADLFDHNRSVGFFTTVAATCILGSQCLVLFGWETAAMFFGGFGFVLWAILTYTIFAVMTVKQVKPALADGINGGWLVSVVATQSVSIIAAQVAMSRGGPEPLLFLSLVMWLGGGMLYLWMISLIFYRYTFFPISAQGLAPPYWINMGAVAISTLAGTMLVQASPDAAFLEGLLPFLKGFTLFFWSTATWWIPMLVIFGFWRHVYQRYPIRYDPLYWGAVFPLGMYTVATIRLADAIQLAFLLRIAEGFIWIALAAWSASLLGLVHMLYGRFRGGGGLA